MRRRDDTNMQPTRTSRIYSEGVRAVKQKNMSKNKMSLSRDFVSEGVITGLKEVRNQSVVEGQPQR